jgi:hypothetical protein
MFDGYGTFLPDRYKIHSDAYKEQMEEDISTRRESTKCLDFDGDTTYHGNIIKPI